MHRRHDVRLEGRVPVSLPAMLVAAPADRAGHKRVSRRGPVDGGSGVQQTPARRPGAGAVFDPLLRNQARADVEGLRSTTGMPESWAKVRRFWLAKG
ncbi:hypothetical protein [Streptomyces ortus]|uniref:Transposase n=1 Tax=Streptomyces ortus TaxID=2867268 RepID=A0ABT3VCG5_9ACTN|nr:hypothetical protein [Streptomyces ortus]MCX4236146.1 hypothetical protein [Streptomyces ortus]